MAWKIRCMKMWSTNNNSVKIIKKIILTKKVFILGLTLSLMGAIAELAVPSIVSSFFNKSNFMIIFHNKNNLLKIIILFILMYLIQGLASYLLGLSGAYTIEEFQNQFVNHLIKLPVKLIDKYNSGDLSSRLTNDISELTKLLTVLIPQLIINLIIIIGSIVILIFINYKLTLLLLLLVPIMLLINIPINKKIENLFSQHQTILGLISDTFIQKIINLKIIKSYLGEQQEKERFSKMFHNFFDNTKSIVALMSVFTFLISISILLFIVSLAMYISNQYTQGYISMNTIIIFSLYIVQIVNPLLSLTSSISEIFEVKGAIGRVDEVFNLNIRKDNAYAKLNEDKYFIRIKNLSFSYENDNVLKNINLTLPNNKLTVIIGSSGSGKTTLLSIMNKLLFDYDGRVFIGNKDIRSINNADYRKIVSFAAQDNALFSGTIKDNLLYGKNINFSNDNLISAIRNSQAEAFIRNKKMGLDTLIGENGKGLSEGQKQRLNIARALVSKPKILLLDEITSSLDITTEEDLMKDIKRISKDTTTVMVAHRSQAIDYADYIVILNRDGTVKYAGLKESLQKIGKLDNKIFNNR